MPRVARSQSPKELKAWSVAGLGLAVSEAGFIAVVIKNVFAGSLSPELLNMAVALGAATPAMANLMSFFWADFGAGRAKANTVTVLLLLAALSLLLVAWIPAGGLGVLLFICAMFFARTFWTGALTLRSAVWRANYPSEVRARFTSRITVLGALAMAVSSAVCGYYLDESVDNFRVFYPVAAACLAIGGLFFRAVRVRQQRQLLASELAAKSGQKRGLVGAFSILREDEPYRRYMLRMFFFGSGNLMLVGQAVLLYSEQLAMSRTQQMLIISSIPFLVLPVTLPMWARYFDRVGVVRFRAVQGWFFSGAMIMLFAGVINDQLVLLWLAAALLGIGYAGGSIGWHLGHNAFATDDRATDYMAVHVSLTGLRGILAPVAGVWVYQFLNGINPGYAVFCLLLPLALSASGTLGFMRDSRALQRR
ncbi:MAG: MFS transporter [Pseudomonadota bacterium]